jgi:uncharacterized membrane protein
MSRLIYILVCMVLLGAALGGAVPQQQTEKTFPEDAKTAPAMPPEKASESLKRHARNAKKHIEDAKQHVKDNLKHRTAKQGDEKR